MNWLETALQALRQGRIVAVATESYFALAGDALSPDVLDTLIEIKGRDAGKGIGLLAARHNWKQLVTRVPAPAEQLAAQFWPGPLTLVLPARRELDARLVVDGGVALRVPGPSSAQLLVEAWGGPLTATSANVAGQPPCRTSEQVRQTFDERMGLHVVDGEGPGGEVSTLLRLTGERAEVLRVGAVSLQALTQFMPSGI